MSLKGFDVNGVIERYDYNSLDNLPESALFKCTYGTTTASQISQALSDGKVCYCIYGASTYYLADQSGGIYVFTTIDKNLNQIKKLRVLGSTWSFSFFSLQELLDFDTTPTSGSDNPVTSGGVYTALQNVGGGGEPYQQYPEMDGVASPGSSDEYARGNHVHPTDTSRAAASEITRIDAALATKADQASIEQTIEDTVDDWLTEQATTIGTLSYAAKQALLACFRKVAWIDDQGQSYYNALESELFPDATLESITAVFTQGSATIYTADTLDTLKQYLTVTATYSDSTTAVVTDYTLSGTLAAGTSTITVSYGGKTDTFTVNVTESPLWVFVNGHSLSKGTSSVQNGKVYVSSTASRACGNEPIANKNYVFTVTDTSKYQLVAYDITDNTPIEFSTSVTGYMYQAGSKSISWKSSDSVTTPYVWLSLKKISGSFTEAELANGAEAVFTFTTT